MAKSRDSGNLRAHQRLGGRGTALLCALVFGAVTGPAAAGGADFRGGPALQDGETEHRFTLDSTSWADDEREDAVQLTPYARYGVAAGYDVAIAAPMRREDEDEGLRALHLEAGFPLTGRDAATNVTLVVHGRVLPGAPPLASGKNGWGLAVHLSDDRGGSGTRLDGVLGFERADSAFRDTPGYQAVNRLHYANRIEQSIGGRWAVSGEARAVIGVTGDEVQNQFAFSLRPGIRYSPSPRVTWRLSAGRDMVERGAEPETTVRLSLIHRPAPAPARRELEARLATLERERIPALEEQSDRLATGVAVLSGRLEEERERLDLLKQRTGLLDVEIINRTGDRRIGDAAVAHMERLGHQVVRRLERPAGPVQEVTHIEYRDGFAEAAAELEHGLPGIQIVTADPGIVRGADVRLVLGTDLAPEDEASEDEASEDDAPEDETPADAAGDNERDEEERP